MTVDLAILLVGSLAAIAAALRDLFMFSPHEHGKETSPWRLAIVAVAGGVVGGVAAAALLGRYSHAFIPAVAIYFVALALFGILVALTGKVVARVIHGRSTKQRKQGNGAT